MGSPYVFGSTATGKPFEQHQPATKERSHNNAVNGAPEHHHRNMPPNTRNAATQPHHAHGTQSHQAQPHHQNQNQAPPLPRQQPSDTTKTTTITSAALLRHCTTGRPLTEPQVIALSDVVGSLKELVALVRAVQAGDEGCEKRLVNALGYEAAGDVVAFWGEEWEVE